MKKVYWINCDKCCGGVETENDIIISSFPFVGVFIGQKVDNLFNWVNKKFKNVKIEEIK